MWTDVFQVFVIFSGLIIIVTIGLSQALGLKNVVEINWKYGKINLLKLVEKNLIFFSSDYFGKKFLELKKNSKLK